MTDELCRLREDELSFFAKIGADISHEMRNVLSIVNENAGLLDDQLALARGRKVPDLDKLKKVSARIARQVGKGVEVMECFSRFAHAADEPRATVDLVGLVGDVTVLAQRHVRNLGRTLEVTLPEGTILTTTNPFCLQHAVFLCLRIVWEAAEPGAPVSVELAGHDTVAVLTISAAGGADGTDLADGRAQWKVVLDELDARVETSNSNGVLSLVLTLPIRSS
jgi:hypothetical protein